MRRAPLALLTLAACIQVEAAGEDAGPVCGDGVVEGEEACDPGADATCDESCRPRCGNGRLDDGEACDDGDANGPSAPCSERCTDSCGDGVVQPHEACDPGPVGEAPGCRSDCTSTCGDGVLDPGEACDAGPANDDRAGSCTAACTLPACGDGRLHAREPCDGTPGCTAACEPGACAAVEVTAGYDETLVRMSDGRVLGFGRNEDGRLPGVVGAEIAAPAELALPRLVRLAQGDGFGLGIAEDGSLLSWGRNERGQRGVGHLEPVSGYSRVADGPFRALGTARSTAFAIDEEGALWSFGSNEHGATGLGVSEGVPCPGEYVRATCEDGSSCPSGRCERFGGSNSLRCVPPEARCVTLPARVETGAPVLQVAGGWHHAVAITAEGKALAWGLDDLHQAGTVEAATTGCECVERPAPIELPRGLEDTRFQQVAAGGRYALLLEGGEALWGFGENQYGQLGIPDASELLPAPPRKVDLQYENLGSKILLLASGDHSHGLFVATEGSQVWSFGHNRQGQLGVLPIGGDGNVLFDRPIEAIEGRVFAADGGWVHSAEIAEPGTQWTYGHALYGKLGHGTAANEYRPSPEVVQLCP